MSDYISMKDLVEARKEEMQAVFPGYTTEVQMGDKSVKVQSPSVFERDTFRVQE